ncbi:MAG: hypothetical protein QOF51_203 [Chloroflexota bacterium]|jgi:uncharacterized protein GlcG (DUF336 family)|nr:hypothetical protein [Chloroflexota bacterium]
MVATQRVYLTLAEARTMIDRGLAKAAELHQAGAIVVVDAGGDSVSISRMDDGPVSAIHVSHAKAYLAAVQGRPTAAFALNAHDRPEIFSAFQHILPQQPFPGPGGMPVIKGGRVVGGIATGGGIGPYTEIAGVDPGALMVDGVQANAEDIVICAALGIPYASQHGDRSLCDPRASTESPVTPLPLGLDEARGYADGAMAYAASEGMAIGVAVVDEMGRLIQNDRMDDAPYGSCPMAEAKAMSAMKFRRATSGLAEEFRGNSARMRAIEKILSFTILALGGGVPIVKDGRQVGAIGVSGSGARATRGGTGGRDEEVALAALDLG